MKGTDVSRSLPGKAAFLLAGLLLLGACASPRPINFQPPPLRHAGPEIQIADVDVLAVTPEMDEFLQRYILPYPNSHTKIQLLYQTVLPSGVLDFDYDESLTLTAAEAFEMRSGNCVGFANMMIALARRAGLKARYQEIFQQPEWSMNEDTLFLVKHMNVVVETSSMNYILDVSGIQFGKSAHRQIVDDNYAMAFYLNNLGVKALIEGNLPLAYAYIKKAITVEPRVTDSWVNLGVVLSRNDQLDDTIIALQTALKIDPTQISAMNNLYEAYAERGDQQAARELQARVEKYRQNNPYYLLYQSELALESDRFEESLKLLNRAIREKENDHILYFYLAKTQYLSGDITAAERSLERARELAPQDMKANYARPLDELVAELQAEAAAAALAKAEEDAPTEAEAKTPAELEITRP